MVKLTKRKGFNFFRSYYDVYNELSDKDKVKFMDALLDRQFLGTKPTKLNGLAKFAYISQTNSIDSQVKGYEDKTDTKLFNTPTVGGAHGGTEPPTLQVEVEEKVEVQYVVFENFYNFYNKKVNKAKAKKLFEKLTEYELNSIRTHLPEYIKSTPDKQYRKSPDGYLKNKCWNDEIIGTMDSNPPKMIFNE